MFLTAILFFLQVYSVNPCTITTPLGNGTIYNTVNVEDEPINGTNFTFTLWTDAPASTYPGERFSVEVYGVGAAFRAQWDESRDFLARAGLDWPKDKYYWEYGNLFADFAYTRTECERFEDTDGKTKCRDDVAGDYSYIGVYGWSVEPLVEYYVVDDWLGNTYISDHVNVQEDTICYDIYSAGGSCKVGEITVDGGVYDVYKGYRWDKPSILGNTDFVQYFSVRRISRKCGTISITKHFKEWESMGLPLGKMYEAKILVESGGGHAYVDYSHADVYIEPDECNPQSDDHYEEDPSGNSTCVLRLCINRRKNSLNPLLPCGTTDCYWDMGNTNATKCIQESTPCTDSDLYQQNSANRTCELKLCANRVPIIIDNRDWPCGSTCYLDINGTSCIPTCDYGNDNGKCLPECTSRDPIINIDWPCKSACYLDLAGTNCTLNCPHDTTDKGKCILTPCSQRTPDETIGGSCALPEDAEFAVPCYKDVGGTNPNKCALECSNPFYETNNNTGLCILMPCADRTPVIHPLPGDEVSLDDFVIKKVYVTVTNVTFYAKDKCSIKVQITIDGVTQNSSIRSSDTCNADTGNDAAVTLFPDEETLVWTNVASYRATVLVFWQQYSATAGAVDLAQYENAGQPTDILVQNTISWGDGDIIDARMNVVVERYVQPCGQRHPNTSASAGDACKSSEDGAVACVPDGTIACYEEGYVNKWPCGTATESPMCIKDGGNCKVKEGSAASLNRRACGFMVALLWVMLFLYW